MASFVWPTIDTPAKATQAMRDGSSTAALSALLTGGVGGAALYLGHPVFGFDAWSLVDAGLLAIVAWRVYRLSLPWSIVGLVMFTLGRGLSLLVNPRLSFALVTILFFFYYLNAVRGGFYLRNHKPSTADAAPGDETTQPAGRRARRNGAGSAEPSRLPECSIDEYTEFLNCMKRGERRFQTAGRSVHDEYAAWLKDRRRRAAQAEAAAAQKARKQETVDLTGPA